MDGSDPLAVDAACPLLGIRTDRPTRYTFPHLDHRCFAAVPAVIEPSHQVAFCLGPGFAACHRYPEDEQVGAPRPDRGPDSAKVVTPYLSVTPRPARQPRRSAAPGSQPAAPRTVEGVRELPTEPMRAPNEADRSG